MKVLANQSVMFNVTYSTRKNNPYGLHVVPVPIEIKNGPTYTIKFISKLTIPELSMSTELLDFGKVCVNTRKTVKIRLENKQEVPCEWKFCAKNPMPEVMMVGGSGARDKEGDRFQVWPHSGLLLPGQRTTIDVLFTPNGDKPFTQKLTFKCTDNLKPFILNTKGQGINYMVDFN